MRHIRPYKTRSLLKLGLLSVGACLLYITLPQFVTIPTMIQSVVEEQTTTVKPPTPPVTTEALDVLPSVNFVRATRVNNVTLALVICGNRLSQAVTLLKSVVVTTFVRVRVIIMAEEKLHHEIWRSLDVPWANGVLQIEVLPLRFPDSGNEWKQVFKPCATQRLFLASVLPDVKELIYTDTDIIFLSPIEEVYDYFSEMGPQQLAAMAPESEDFATGWYNRFAQHPYVRPLGVNSGVMLMNLTAMRLTDWENQLTPIYRHYKTKLSWGDQDIINVYFHNRTEMLYILPCRYNYRMDHCMYTSVCKSAEKDGIAILHGNREVFISDKQLPFRVVYDEFQKLTFKDPLAKEMLILALNRRLRFFNLKHPCASVLLSGLLPLKDSVQAKLRHPSR